MALTGIIARTVGGSSVSNALRQTFRCSNLQKQMVQRRSLSVTSALLKERRFSEKHEWVIQDGDIATIGISHYAQESLGEIVYVQLPDLKSSFAAHDEVGAVESVKAASEIYTPLTGEVVELNSALEEKPSLVNTSCYDDGWLFKMKISDKKELDKLMTEPDYEKYLKTVAH